MNFGMKIGWTTVLEGDAQAWGLLKQLRELVMALGSQGLHVQVKPMLPTSRIEDVAGDMVWSFSNAHQRCRNTQDIARSEVYLHPTPAVPEDFREIPPGLVVHYPPGLRESPEAYPVDFTWRMKPLRHEQLMDRIERFLHLTAPSWVRFQPFRRPPGHDYLAGPTSLMYFDAEHVAQLRALGVPIKPAVESKLGAWFRVHDEAVDSLSKAAWRAHQVFWASVDPLFDKRKLEAQRRWRPTPGLDASPQGPTGRLAPGAGAAPVELPSYLVRVGEAVAPALAAPMVASQARIVEPPRSVPAVDETVLGARALVGNAVPFRGSAAPPPARPIEPSPDQGETAMLPVSSELLAAVARSQARVSRVAELDATLPPIRQRGPVIPFAGATSPEQAKALAGPPAARSEDAGETLALPLPHGLAARAGERAADAPSSQAPPRPSMPLQIYAMLRHALSAPGADQEHVRSRFGVSAEELRQIEQQYFELFRAEPKTQQAFVALLQRLRNPGDSSGGHRDMTARSALAGALTLMGFACSAPVPQSASPGVDVSIEKPPTSAPPCTEMGCVEGMLVHFVTPPMLSAGGEIFDHPRTYEVEVEADDRRGSCRITVPCSIAVDEVCTGDLRMRLLKDDSGWYNRKGLEDQRYGVTGFTLPSPPRQLRVRVLRDGELVGEHSAAPVVRELRPNGPGCEPVCRVGEPLELKLPIALTPDQPEEEKRVREREERERKRREREAREHPKATP